MGSRSKMDSLSYAMGFDIGMSIQQGLRDIPFNFDELTLGLEKAALDKATMTLDQTNEILRPYMMSTANARRRAIAVERAKADSARWAAGDSTQVEYPVADEAMFESEAERNEISYAMGANIGYSLAQSPLPLAMVWVCAGVQDVHNGTPQMNEYQCRDQFQNYEVQMLTRNQKASEAWLAKVAKKSGVQRTESGLLYKIVKEGDPEVKATSPLDRVKVHYTGRTRTGKVFDSSHFNKRPKAQQEMMRERFPDMFDEKGNPKDGDEPAEFMLNGVIPGWTEGMQLVGKGGKIILWLPSELAYGARGAGQDIQPNDALEFEVELLDVVPFETPASVSDAEDEAFEE